MARFLSLRRSLLLIGLALGLLYSPAARAQLAAPDSLPRGDVQASGFSSEKLAAIDALLKTAIDNRQIAGGAALVARQGKIVHLAMAGMQDAEAAVPIRADTIYRIASMTKPITSVAAMMLVDDGQLVLDDPVAKYIPEFKTSKVLLQDAPAKSPITVRHLLTHTSGITYGFWDKPILGKLYREAGVSDGLIETDGTIADNCRRLAGLPLMFEPGTSWEYGLNTDVLGRVVEVASDQSLDDFFRTRIFQPLRMVDTHFALPKEKHPRLAALYAPDDAKKIRRVTSGPQTVGATRYSPTYPLTTTSKYHSGGAGLVSTLGDYARFCQMLLNKGELDGQRILKPETVAAMTTNQVKDFALSIPVHGDRFGYGFGVVTAAGKPSDIASVGSFSWGGIFYTYFLVDPEKQLILIFLTQVYPWDHLTLHGDFKRLAYEALIP